MPSRPGLIRWPRCREKRRPGRTCMRVFFKPAHMALHGRAHRFGREHGWNLAVAAQRFFEQMKALGHRQALFGDGAARNRLANIFQQADFAR